MVQSFAILLKLLLTLLLPAHRLLVQYSDPARAGGSLAVVDPTSGTLTDLHTPFTSFGSLSVAQVNHFVFHTVRSPYAVLTLRCPARLVEKATLKRLS